LREIDSELMEIKNNPEKLDRFISEHKKFILGCAYKHTKRYITVSDDEYSVALAAFSEAVKSFEIEKGSFLSFAEQLIGRRLVDYFRMQKKFSHEIQVDPHVFETDSEEDTEDVPIRIMVAEKISYQPDDSLKYEIEAANKVFGDFGFRFYDLAECSPKAKKTKNACISVVKYIINNTDILKEIYSSKQLPIKNIEKNTKLPRKIIERHRKYIIAAVEILSGEYPFLSEYMWTIRKELNK